MSVKSAMDGGCSTLVPEIRANQAAGPNHAGLLSTRENSQRLGLWPITLKEAKEFIGNEHRHHAPPVGHKWSIGAELGGKLVGVIVVGRPVARMTATREPQTCEVTRLATDGTKNACSFLYSAAARAAKAMGYKKIQTFILDTESGVTLDAAGWTFEKESPGGEWKHTSGPRRKDQPTCPKRRYAKFL